MPGEVSRSYDGPADAPGRIPIGAARDLSRRYGCPMVVVFAITPSGDSFNLTTYGATKKLCKLAADIGDQFADAVLGGTVGPPETEPEGVEVPAVFAGRKSP